LHLAGCDEGFDLAPNVVAALYKNAVGEIRQRFSRSSSSEPKVAPVMNLATVRPVKILHKPVEGSGALGLLLRSAKMLAVQKR
jgi:hypothetical protein